jgi:hypothetical protein
MSKLQEEQETELIKLEPDEKRDGALYDAVYLHGNPNIGYAKIFIVAPKITKEENEKRWDYVNQVALEIVNRMIREGELDKFLL